MSLPRLPPHPNENKNLNKRVDDDLADDACQDLSRDQTGSRPLMVDFRVWQGTSHCQLATVQTCRVRLCRDGAYWGNGVDRDDAERNSLATAIGMMTNKSM